MKNDGERIKFAAASPAPGAREGELSMPRPRKVKLAFDKRSLLTREQAEAKAERYARIFARPPKTIEKYKLCPHCGGIGVLKEEDPR